MNVRASFFPGREMCSIVAALILSGLFPPVSVQECNSLPTGALRLLGETGIFAGIELRGCLCGVDTPLPVDAGLSFRFTERYAVWLVFSALNVFGPVQTGYQIKTETRLVL